jgi:hypothetical protein
VELYEPDLHGHHAYVYGGHDPGGCALNFGALCRWVLGRPDEARSTCGQSIELGERVGHRPSLMISLLWSSITHLLCCDYERAGEEARTGEEIAKECGLAWDRACLLVGSVSEALQRPGEPVEPRLIEACLLPSVAGSEFILPYHQATIAWLVGKAGDGARALGLLDAAMPSIERYGAHWTLAEHHRVRGELLRLLGSDEASVEACFVRSLEVAARQGARSWELRTRTSLARLRISQGRTEEARPGLAAALETFDGATDTRDLREARALLAALA